MNICIVYLVGPCPPHHPNHSMTSRPTESERLRHQRRAALGGAWHVRGPWYLDYIPCSGSDVEGWCFFFSPNVRDSFFYENIIFTRFFWLLGNFFGNIFAKLQPKQFLRIFFEEIQVANRKVCWKRDEFVEWFFQNELSGDNKVRPFPGRFFT